MTKWPFSSRSVRASTLAVSALLALPAAGTATSLPLRTFDVSELAPPAAGQSAAAADPAVSADGSVVAFDSPAPAGGRQVYAVNILTGFRTLVSAAPGGVPANGSSVAPTISADGSAIAFLSTATDLVAGAPAGEALYVSGGGMIRMISAVDVAGAPGAVSEPVSMSADGTAVAFTSATALTSDDTNGEPDVYVCNLDTNVISLVSAAAGGGPANGASGNPSISANGRYVSFESSATNVVSGSNGGVFVRDLAASKTDVVSVSTRGANQNMSVGAPFHQISSISADGRYVAFDSNATNLVQGDVNRRTDVFLRDRKRRTTILVSENNAGFEGNNDSFFPTISPDGKKIAFESLASQLARGGGPRENVFVRDVALGLTSVVDVGPTGLPLNAEAVKQLLQRPAISRTANVAAFETTAPNLTGQSGGEPHVFVRLMDPPRGVFQRPPPFRTRSRRVPVNLRADERRASAFACRIDGGTPFVCRPGAFRLPKVRLGRHVLTVRAGGPGMLYDPLQLKATFRVVR